MEIEAIQVELFGSRLSNPTMLASGVHGSSLDRVLEAIRVGAGAAVTKSIGPVPREGYPEPTIVEVQGGMVNASGLPNPGASAFSEQLNRIDGKRLPVVTSVFGKDENEFADVVGKLDGHDFLAYELNLSCPHVSGVGTEIGHFPEAVSRVVKSVKGKTRKPVLAKLSPNTDRLVEVARAAADAGADGFTAINAVKAFPIDVETGRRALTNGFGGLTGAAIHTVALRCVYELRANFALPIIGCGGVYSWEDAVRFLAAGASAVQVGTATLKKFDLYNDINLGLIAYLERKGLRSVGDLVGAAHRR